MTDDPEAELRNFAQHSRAVVADAVGLARLTWQERAEWADACADAARGAVSDVETLRRELHASNHRAIVPFSECRMCAADAERLGLSTAGGQ
jgi:hypothetical protein